MKNERVMYRDPNRPVRAGVSEPKSAGWRGAYMHLHPELEFIYVEKGRMENELESGSFFTEAGDIAFFNSRVPHGTVFLEEGTVQHLLQFRVPHTFRGSFRYLSFLLSRVGKDSFVFHPQDEDHAHLLSCFLDIEARDAEPGAAADYMITSHVFFIISLLYKRGLLQDERASFDFGQLQKLMPLFEYIDEHFAEEITLDSCASLLCLNKSYLCRLFRNATGTTLWDFINFVRVCKSEEMLAENKNLSEIAYAVGFSSPSYFHRTFKKYKNLAPSEYRKLYEGREKMLLS